MENTERFGKLSARMHNYRESILTTKPYIDAERALLATEAYQEHYSEPAVMKRALMLKNILENMTIYIEDESLLVGNQATKNRNAPIFPEYTLKFVLDELDLFEKRDGDVFYITDETKEELRSIESFWKNKTLRDIGFSLFPEEVSVYMETGFFGMEGKLNSGDAHIAVDYTNLLKYGLKGYEERTKKYMAELDMTKYDSIDKYQFYKSVLIVISAIKDFANRYADLAREEAKGKNEKRRSELLRIADICNRVPYEPAANFMKPCNLFGLFI